MAPEQVDEAGREQGWPLDGPDPFIDEDALKFGKLMARAELEEMYERPTFYDQDEPEMSQ